MKKWIISTIVALCILLAIFISLVTTPMGLRLSFDIAKHILPGTLSSKKLTGRLMGTISIEQLTYSTANQTIIIQQLQLHWHPSQLISGLLHITRLNIHNLVIKESSNATPASQSSPPIPKLSLPVDLIINHAHVHNIKILQDQHLKMHVQNITIQQLSLQHHRLHGRVTWQLNQPYKLNAAINFAGQPKHYQLQITLASQHFKWQLHGQGNQQQVKLTTRQSHLLSGQLQGHINFSWLPHLRWDAQLNAQKINLRPLSPHLPQQISLQLQTQGSWYQTLHFSLITHLSTPGAQLNISAKKHHYWHAHWQIKIKQLQSLLPDSRGELNTQGQLDNTLQKLKLNTTVTIQHLQFLHYHITKLIALAKINDGFHQMSSVQVTASDLRTPSINLPSLQIKGYGTQQQHKIHTIVNINIPKLGKLMTQLSLDGHVTQQGWHAHLKQFNLKNTKLGVWHLKSPSQLIIKHHFVLSALCLQQQKTHYQTCLKLSFNQQGIKSQLKLLLQPREQIITTLDLPNYRLGHALARQAISGKIQITQINMKTFNNLLAGQIQLRGHLMANIQVSGTVTQPLFKGQLSLKNGRATITPLKITLTQLSALINAQGQHLAYKIKALSKNQPLLIQGSTQLNQTGFPTQLTITANKLLVINTSEYQVYASPKLKIDFNAKHINVSGNIDIPQASLKPVSFNSTTTLPDDVEIIGRTKRSQPLPYHLAITITMGNNVRINGFGLTGKVTGRIKLNQQPKQPILASGQLLLVNGLFTFRNNKLTIETNSGVSYQNSPINNPNLQISATRNISVNQLSSLSSTIYSTIKVGVTIQGTLRRPQMSLFSSPITLSQANILSLLVFGQPANSNSPANIGTLLSVVDGLPLGKSNPGGIASEITQSLGLTEFGVQSQTTLDALGTPLGRDQSAFVVGRYITPRIYLRFTRGLIYPINIYQVRYLLGRNFAIQTETSSLGTGGDILYTLEGKPWQAKK